ncbi:transposase, partial [Thiohalocapsa sp.]|uniref:IS91 family transposase n=1 Tax=Thiohalocapsa sp. TaxID=2497641 RepID=UPI0025F69ED4
RRLVGDKPSTAQRAGELKFFGEHKPVEKAGAFAAFLKPLRGIDWVVYAKRPFAGPQAVLAYLARYTHRVAIANSRLIALDEKGVTFKFKDYRAKGRCRYGCMTLPVEEFMRRFLLHVLPPRFHRIRHYGLLANAARVQNLARARELLAAPLSPLIAVPVATAEDATQDNPSETSENARPCPCCGAPMVIIETFARGHLPRAPPSAMSEAA